MARTMGPGRGGGRRRPWAVAAARAELRRFGERLRRRRIGRPSWMTAYHGRRTDLGWRVIRTTLAAVLAYEVARVLLDGPPPLLAPLTALLVAQVTVVETIRSGIQRVASVLAGVLVAVLLSQVLGLTWWGLGLVILASLLIGLILDLGDHQLEVPISAMLVLGVGYASGAEAAALSRVVETLIGAAVGVLVNVLFPPAVRTRYAGHAVQRLAEEIGALLDEAAQGLGAGTGAVSATDSGNFFPTGTGWFTIPSVDRSSGELGLTPDATARWLDDARRLNRHVPRVDRALSHAEESRRLNVRAIGKPQSSRSLRGGLEALELCSVAVRSLFRSVDDWVRGGMAEPDQVYATRVRAAWAELLRDLAVVVRAFGALLRAEVAGTAAAEEAALADALDRLRLDRVRHAEVLLANPREHPDLWELDGALVALVDRMLLELDAAAHPEDRPDPLAGRRTAELLNLLRTRRPPGERGTRAGEPGDPPAAPPEGPAPGRPDTPA
jgi:hypothetical protein